MKLLLDENVAPDTVHAVRAIYYDHDWVSAHEDPGRWCGVDDTDLFAALAKAGFNAIVTQDKNQLNVREEREGLVAAGLHWIGFQAKPWPGTQGLALRSATLLAGLCYVLADWRPEPHRYHLTGVQAESGQRVKVRPIHL